MEPPVPVRPGLVPGVVELGPVVGGGLLDDEHVPGHGVHGQPELGGQQGLVGQSAQQEELGPGQQVLGQELVVSEDDQVVAEEEGCRVGEDSEDLGHDVLTPGPHQSLRHRQVEHEGLDAGDLQVGVCVSVEVVRQAVADLGSIEIISSSLPPCPPPPPLLVTDQGEIKVIFPPLAVLLSKVEPVVSAVV